MKKVLLGSHFNYVISLLFFIFFCSLKLLEGAQEHDANEIYQSFSASE